MKFAGNYHGHSDALLAEGGSGVATLGLSGSAGVTEAAVSETIVAPYNVVPPLDDSVACVIVEPVAANMGLVAPAPGFLADLRAACDAAGALLIFDEVITGFRLGLGGAQGQYGVRPDLTCFGKVIGGGLPIAAFGGREDVMACAGPAGPRVPGRHAVREPTGHGGRAGGAGRAGRRVVRRGWRAGPPGWAPAWPTPSAAPAYPITVPVVGPLVGLHFSATPAVDYDTARTTDTARYGAFFHAMLRRGVALAPGPYEVAFPGLAHDDAVIDSVLAAAHDAALEVASNAERTVPAT